MASTGESALQALIGLALVGGVGYYLVQSPPKGVSDKDALPNDQKAFCLAVNRARDEAKKAFEGSATARDDRLRELRSERGKAMKGIGPEVSGWQGKIDSFIISSLTETAKLEVDLCEAALRIEEDPKGLLKPQLDKVKEGDLVVVSGSFVVEQGSAHHFKEESLTESGSFDEPEYTFRLKSIRVAE